MTTSLGNKKLDSLSERACSKIIWGEREDEVYQFLRKEGVAPDLIETILERAMRERAALIRKKSLIRLIAGTIGALICGGVLAWFEFNPDVRFTGRGYFQLVAALWTGLVICGGFALKNGWSLLTGKSLGAAVED